MERDEVEQIKHAHAAYYMALAETTSAQWDTSSVDASTELLDQEQDNMRAALQWSLDSGNYTLGILLGVALGKYWRRRGYYGEGGT
ncbi:MAG: hypothetical protein H0X30_16990, partial [Anaerolineae bacterium]|nr:hypothetical protein [Anaerolineae bacterium]